MKRIALFIAALVWSSCSFALDSTQVILDFEEGLTTFFGSDAIVITDADNGGATTITPNFKNFDPAVDLIQPGAGGSGHAVDFDIHLEQAGYEWGPQAILRMNAMPDGVSSGDLTGWSGISFWHKGDAFEVHIMLSGGVGKFWSPFVAEVASSADWQLITLDWESFAQYDEPMKELEFDLTDIIRIDFRFEGSNNTDLEIGLDEISLFSSSVPLVDELLLPAKQLLEVGESLSLDLGASPAESEIGNIQWTSSDISVVKVSDNGELFGVASGTAYVSATMTEFPNATITTEVVVWEQGELAIVSEMYADFENGNGNVDGVYFYAFNDSKVKGKSTIYSSASPNDTVYYLRSNDGANGTDYNMAFDFKLDRAEYEYDPFAGVVYPTGNDNASRDISMYDGVELYFKGDPIWLAFDCANHPEKDYDFYRVPIPAADEWTKYTFYWDEFKQQGWGMPVDFDIKHVRTLEFSARSETDMEGSFAIDEIAFFKSSYIAHTGVSLPLTKTINLNESIQLLPVLTPINATDTKYSWRSSDASVAQISSTGLLTGLSVGTAEISVRTPDGYMATMRVNVEEFIIEPVSISLMSKELEIGEVYLAQPMVMPTNAAYSSIEWSSSDEAVISVDSSGLISAISVGDANVTALISGTTISTTVKYSVKPEAQLLLSSVPDQQFSAEALSAGLDLSAYVISSAGSVTWARVAYTNATATVTGQDLSIEYDNSAGASSGYVILSATDESGQKTAMRIGLKYMEDIAAPYSDTLSFPYYVKDPAKTISLVNIFSSYTKGTEADLAVESHTFGIDFSVKSDVAIVTYSGSGIEPEYILLAYNSETVVVEIIPSSAENTAPNVEPIPEQFSYNGMFASLDLSAFVIDDYTMPDIIEWKVFESGNIDISIYGSVMYASPVSGSWIGSESVWLYAEDQAGLYDSVELVFTIIPYGAVVADAPPFIDFNASTKVATPGTEIQFYANIINADSWLWNFTGADSTTSMQLNETVTYSSTGLFDVKLKAQNGLALVDSTIKNNFIKIIGITNRDTSILAGESITLTVNGGVTDYTWSTGDANTPITVTPDATTSYSVNMAYGLFTYTDEIEVRVLAPADLGDDRGICNGAKEVLNPGEFKAYTWSDGSTDPTLVVEDAGTYSVTVHDGNFSSVASVTISVFDVEPLDLGGEIAICPNEKYNVSAPEAAGYLWSDGSKLQTRSLDAGEYSLTLTDVNGCQSIDTILLLTKLPSIPSLGVVTVDNDNTNHIVVAWERNSSDDYQSYNIYRYGFNGYEKVGSKLFSELSSFVDTEVDVRQTRYTYTITGVDGCGTESAKSNELSSVHVQKSLDPETGLYNLEWTLYDSANASGYYIYGGADLANLAKIDEVGNTSTVYNILDPTMQNYIFRVAAVLKSEVKPNVLKNDSGPFSQSLSNLSEAVIADEISVLSAGSFVLAPNPATETISLSFDNASISVFNYSIVDGLGQSVAYGSADVADNVISVSELSAGVYTLKVVVGNEVLNLKFIKE